MHRPVIASWFAVVPLVLSLAACASFPLPTEHLAQAESGARAATELGASKEPSAAAAPAKESAEAPVEVPIPKLVGLSGQETAPDAEAATGGNKAAAGGSPPAVGASAAAVPGSLFGSSFGGSGGSGFAGFAGLAGDTYPHAFESSHWGSRLQRIAA